MIYHFSFALSWLLAVALSVYAGYLSVENDTDFRVGSLILALIYSHVTPSLYAINQNFLNREISIVIIVFAFAIAVGSPIYAMTRGLKSGTRNRNPRIYSNEVE